MTESVSLSSESFSPPPFWTVNPDNTDWLAWAAIASIALAIYLVFYLYGKFDDWAEHKAKGTPLAITIPTLLAIALLYEIFPLDHFNILLPLSAILISLMADWRRESGKTLEDEFEVQVVHQSDNSITDLPSIETEIEPENQPTSDEHVDDAKKEEMKNV